MSSSSSPFRSTSMRNMDPFEAVLEKEQHAVNEAFFAADVGSRMRVPKRITLTGAEDDLFAAVSPAGFNRASSFASSGDPAMRNMMTVPDRILVAGQDRHVGDKGPPRELKLERVILPPATETVRVQTPPRVLTLDEYQFPAADEPPTAEHKSDSSQLTSPDSSNESASTLSGHPPVLSKVDVEINFSRGTPALNRSMSINVLQALQQHLSRLNRRVMDLEVESHQRQQRDTLLGVLAAAYILLKAVNWLRS